jgi:hypothetical protein
LFTALLSRDLPLLLPAPFVILYIIEGLIILRRPLGYFTNGGGPTIGDPNGLLRVGKQL